MATTASYRRARQAVLAASASEDDERTVRRAILDAIAPAVPFDAYAWLTTDPVTCVGTSPLAEVPCLPELPTLIRLKYLTTVNRWTDLGPDARTLAESTGGNLGQSLLWRAFLHRYAVVDVASTVQRDRFGCWGFLDLWRTQGACPFSRADAEFLTDLASPVTAALRRGQARTFAQVAGDRGAPSDPVVLVLSDDLRIRGRTAATAAHLSRLLPPDGGRAPVPAAVFNVGAALVAREEGVHEHPAVARVHLAGGSWLTLRAARLGAAAGGRDIAVTLEATSPGERLDLLSRACGLTARERELLELLVGGGDTRELAHRMSVSEHTVQDHLKSVFAKTGTHSRRALVARVLGPGRATVRT